MGRRGLRGRRTAQPDQVRSTRARTIAVTARDVPGTPSPQAKAGRMSGQLPRRTRGATFVARGAARSTQLRATATSKPAGRTTATRFTPAFPLASASFLRERVLRRFQTGRRPHQLPLWKGRSRLGDCPASAGPAGQPRSRPVPNPIASMTSRARSSRSRPTSWALAG